MIIEVGPILSELGAKAACTKLDPKDEQRVAELVSELKSIFDAYPRK
jgi:hypothetical protein